MGGKVISCAEGDPKVYWEQLKHLPNAYGMTGRMGFIKAGRLTLKKAIWCKRKNYLEKGE